MAIYHLSAQVLSRSRGRSAVACAAYRSGQKLKDERYERTHDYTRRDRVQEAFILAPEGAPAWVEDRELLWNEVERGEKRKDSQLAREINLALPKELSPEQRRELLVDYVQRQFVERGMVADVAIHDAPWRGDQRNHHAHVMLTMRELGPAGFGKKNTAWNARSFLEEARTRWAELANEHLERAGHEERIDHRSLEAQREEALKRGQYEEAVELARPAQQKRGLVRHIERREKGSSYLYAAQVRERAPELAEYRVIRREAAEFVRSIRNAEEATKAEELAREKRERERREAQEAQRREKEREAERLKPPPLAAMLQPRYSYREPPRRTEAPRIEIQREERERARGEAQEREARVEHASRGRDSEERLAEIQPSVIERVGWTETLARIPEFGTRSEELSKRVEAMIGRDAEGYLCLANGAREEEFIAAAKELKTHWGESYERLRTGVRTIHLQDELRAYVFEGYSLPEEKRRFEEVIDHYDTMFGPRPGVPKRRTVFNREAYDRAQRERGVWDKRLEDTKKRVGEIERNLGSHTRAVAAWNAGAKTAEELYPDKTERDRVFTQIGKEVEKDLVKGGLDTARERAGRVIERADIVFERIEYARKVREEMRQHPERFRGMEWDNERGQGRGRQLRRELPDHGRERGGREGPEHDRGRGGPELGM